MSDIETLKLSLFNLIENSKCEITDVLNLLGPINDYIKDGINGYMIDRGNLAASLEQIIRKAYAEKDHLKNMGAVLKKDVLELFSDSAKNRKRFIDLIA